MLLITDLNTIPPDFPPCGLTIGSFDGVHLGHQALLKTLREKIGPTAPLVVFTFSNHPSHHFNPNNPVPLICPPLQKAKLLETYGADVVILTPFTLDFSQTEFDVFLSTLKKKLKFTHLVLGTGATFGRHKQGNEENVGKMAFQLDFQVEYLPKSKLHGEAISSGRIRSYITQGAFDKVEEGLGRPYSLLGHLVEEGSYYVMKAEGLCLPPKGSYSVMLKAGSEKHPAKADVDPLKHQICIERVGRMGHLPTQEIEIVF